LTLCVDGRLAETDDPNGHASIQYEGPGATVTSDRLGVKTPTVRPRNVERGRTTKIMQET
jgi:hypothetical protein